LSRRSSLMCRVGGRGLGRKGEERFRWGRHKMAYAELGAQMVIPETSRDEKKCLEDPRTGKKHKSLQGL